MKKRSGLQKSFYIPKDLYSWLVSIAKKEGKSISQVVADIIRDAKNGK